MDGHKHQGLSDDALEREIEAALGVDPSPEFLPRVRARIANERMREGWMSLTPWRSAGAVVVVAMVVVAGVWSLREPATAPREARIAPPIESTAPAIEPTRPAPVTAPVVRAVHTTPRPEVVTPFEVVIAPDEAMALRQLFTAIGNRRLEAAALPDLQSALRPPAPIEEIVLEPITISPLAALEGE